MTDLLELKVGTTLYRGFEQVRVSVGIEQLAGDFELGGSDPWAAKVAAVLPGQTCSVTIAGVPVITGFVDDDEPSYSSGSHQLVLRGRDATGDLVDSAAQTDGQGWEGRTLAEVAQDLCKPFGIPVTVSGDAGPAYKGDIFAKPMSLTTRSPFRSTHINPGETVFEVLSRAAQLRGALIMSDQLGGLLITRAGARRASTTLRRGVNILAGSALHSHRRRFREYQVIGQQNGAFAAIEDQQDAQQVLATATDPSIRAGRRHVIVTSDDGDDAMAQQVATWARANAAALGERATIRVQGWLDAGSPWRPNTLVDVDDDYLRVSGTWLIGHIDFMLDDRDGEITELTLMPPYAYVPQPAAEADPTETLQ